MGGGPESQINTWKFVRKTAFFLKEIKCTKQPKKQNKINFYFSLSGVPNVRGGWVGSNVWDKVQKKTFFLHLPLLGWKIGSPSHVAYKEIGRGSLYWCTSCPPDGLAPLGRHVVSCLDKNILLSLCPHFVSVCATFWTPSSCALSHITQLC